MDQISVLKHNDNFKPGMNVRILGGPFKEFRGKISEVNQTVQKARITVNFFGKEMQADLNYSQIAHER